MQEKMITMAHGSGGAGSAELMKSIFSKRFNSEVLARLEDSAVVDIRQGVGSVRQGDGSSVLRDASRKTEEPSPCLTEPSPCPVRAPDRLAVSTDTFVVSPLVFPGGDIGKLAVCGTVNDVLMSGAMPRWLTCGFILETGLSIELLDEVCASIAKAADEAGVTVIAGDTKVIEGRGEEGGLMINTTGIGVFETQGDGSVRQGDGSSVLRDASRKTEEPSPCLTSPCLTEPSGIRHGDAIIVSGNLGDHHAAILSSRMGIKNNIKSDCALLTPIILALREAGVGIHAMRDVTRGGLATVLNELAAASCVSIELEEERIPVSPEVRAFCGIMGLDPLYMGNEGKMTLAVAPEDADHALAAIQETEIGRDAAIIGNASIRQGDGSVRQGDGSSVLPQIRQKNRPPVLPNRPPVLSVTMKTRIGGTVRLDVLYGEGLPRIC